MNKGSFVLVQSDIVQLAEHILSPGLININGQLHKDIQEGDVSISADVYINSSTFPLIFQMIENQIVIPDTLISCQFSNPRFDPDSENLSITESKVEGFIHVNYKHWGY